MTGRRVYPGGPLGGDEPRHSSCHAKPGNKRTRGARRSAGSRGLRGRGVLSLLTGVDFPCKRLDGGAARTIQLDAWSFPLSVRFFPRLNHGNELFFRKRCIDNALRKFVSGPPSNPSHPPLPGRETNFLPSQGPTECAISPSEWHTGCRNLNLDGLDSLVLRPIQQRGLERPRLTLGQGHHRRGAEALREDHPAP